MPVSVTLHLVAAVALAVQVKIFIYLYLSNRVRFFRYLVWAWVAYAGARTLDLGRDFVPGAPAFLEMRVGLDTIGAFLVLAAALALRWNYAIRPPHALSVAVYAVYAALSAAPSVSLLGLAGGHGTVSIVSGAALVLGGLAFWPRRRERRALAGRRFLSAVVVLWGLHHAVTLFVVSSSERLSVLVDVSNVLVYYLVVFPIVIVVLDRARSEAAALKEFNERLIDGLGEGLQLIDDAFAIRHANRRLAEQFRIVSGRRCYEILTADGRPCPGCPMAERTALSAPVQLRVAGPGDRSLELTCSPVRQPGGEVFLLELVSDVTERERMQNRLTEAERLASVGELAAGVAHEIRNPLASIVNATAILERDTALTGDERVATIGAVRKEARRLNGLLSDFLRFARPGEPKRVQGHVGDVVAHVMGLIGEHRAATPRLVVETHVDPDVPSFAFDPDQLTQVLWNVSLNAIEALKGHGRLGIHARREGGDVVIEVADTGPGIAPDELRRIFEPFYSKRAGGTGLGLPIARRIVTAHGGRIDVESVVGAGTQFLIRIPIA
jgi:signal transduction histidine kinase